jgi:hypothetical protein
LFQVDDAATERNKVAKMLKGISTASSSLVAAMQNIRSNPTAKTNFAAASSELSEEIALIFHGESTPAGRRRRVAGTEAQATAKVMVDGDAAVVMVEKAMALVEATEEDMIKAEEAEEE